VKTRALDSWAILEWMSAREPATTVVRRILTEAEHGHVRLLMSAVNVGEVYYFLRKHHNEALAESWRELSRMLPVTIEVPAFDDIWSAATLKSRFSISYADAFAAALAQKYGCPVLTGDREFLHIEDLEVEWIGSS